MWPRAPRVRALTASPAAKAGTVFDSRSKRAIAFSRGRDLLRRHGRRQAGDRPRRLAGRELLDSGVAGVDHHRGIGLEPLVVVGPRQVVGRLDAFANVAEPVDAPVGRPGEGADDAEYPRLPRRMERLGRFVHVDGAVALPSRRGRGCRPSGEPSRDRRRNVSRPGQPSERPLTESTGRAMRCGRIDRTREVTHVRHGRAKSRPSTMCPRQKQDVDGRDKRGHDGMGVERACAKHAAPK